MAEMAALFRRKNADRKWWARHLARLGQGLLAHKDGRPLDPREIFPGELED